MPAARETWEKPSHVPDDLWSDVIEIRDAVGAHLRGETTEEKFKPFRLHRGIYSQRQPGVNMLRVRAILGRLSAGQLRRIAGVAREYADGRAHLTTRQDVQLYFVKPERVPDAVASLAEVGLTTRESSGATLRNVTLCPRAGFCDRERFDIAPYAEAIATTFLRHPLVQKLPRKVKAAVSGCSEDCALGEVNCLGFVAAERDGVNGFRVLLGGGLGASPEHACELRGFIPADEVVPETEATLRMFDKHGDREHRPKARMKFLVRGKGIDGVRELIDMERPACAKAEPLPAQDNPETLSAFTVFAPTGDLSADELDAIADAVERHGVGWARATITQNLLIPTADEPALRADLEAAGLSEPYADTVVDITACPGASTCRTALIRTKDAAARLSALLRPLAHNEELRGATIRISGCPNSCGQHHVATIGLHGAAATVNGKRMPCYNVFVGGQAEGGARFGRALGRYPARRIEHLVRRLLEMRNELAPERTLADWLADADIALLKEKTADLSDLQPGPGEGASLFVDLGADAPFVIRRLSGECGSK